MDHELLHQLDRSIGCTLLLKDELLRFAAELRSKRGLDEAAANERFDILLIARDNGRVSLEH